MNGESCKDAFRTHFSKITDCKVDTYGVCVVNAAVGQLIFKLPIHIYNCIKCW